MSTLEERKTRAKKIVTVLKRLYPEPKSELHYATPFQFVIAVILSAQCTDKHVNNVTKTFFKKYKTPKDILKEKPVVIQKELSSIPFFRNKTKSIVGLAALLQEKYKSKIPNNESELVALPGIGYKTAHVVLGELYDVYEGIPTDTHVKRFARRFDLTDNTDLKKISKDLEALLPRKDWKYVNNGFVLYGRYVCPARPHECSTHPLTKVWPPANERWYKA